MAYSEEEIRSLIDAGDAERREDGATVWARDNSQGRQPGAWIVRPPGAAPIITRDNADDLGRVRQEKRRQALEEGFAAGVSKAAGLPLTTDEALAAVMSRLAEEGMDPESKQSIRAVQLAFEVLGLPEKKEIVVDKRTQVIEIDAEELHIMRGWSRLDDGRPGD